MIVGCGCGGRMLARELIDDGQVVRGTTRGEPGRAAIEADGAEAVVADPFRLGTLMRPLDGVSVVCWLLAGARGSAAELEALHGPRLESMLELLVDTHVHGFVYEGAGTVPAPLLESGAAAVRRAAATHNIAAEVVTAGRGEWPAWAAAMKAAVAAALS